MAMEATMVATEATTTARGPLMLRLRPLLSPDMAIMAMGTDTTLTDTDTLLLTPTDIILATARGLLMLSPHMVIMGTEDTVEDTMVMVMVMAMEATEDTTLARGLLMPSPDTGTMVTGMVDIVEDTMVMVTVMATDITVEKFQKFMLIQSDFRVQYK